MCRVTNDKLDSWQGKLSKKLKMKWWHKDCLYLFVTPILSEIWKLWKSIAEGKLKKKLLGEKIKK